jgi:hypothetical protein
MNIHNIILLSSSLLVILKFFSESFYSIRMFFLGFRFTTYLWFINHLSIQFCLIARHSIHISKCCFDFQTLILSPLPHHFLYWTESETAVPRPRGEKSKEPGLMTLSCLFIDALLIGLKQGKGEISQQ